MRWCDEVGIISLAYIMIGFIWDTKETLAEAHRFVRTIRPDLITVHYAHPYPGTRYYEAVQAAGYRAESYKAQAEPAFSLPGLSDVALKQYGASLLRRHYLQPRVLFSLLKKGIALFLRTL
jgi:radical SAM superfamily enzyme YgiQ (UPF0313 family)